MFVHQKISFDNISPEWFENGTMSIDRDCCEREYRYVHAKYTDEGTEGAHKVRKVPPLQQGCLELGRKKNVKNDIKYVKYINRIC